MGSHSKDSKIYENMTGLMVVVDRGTSLFCSQYHDQAVIVHDLHYPRLKVG